MNNKLKFAKDIAYSSGEVVDHVYNTAKNLAINMIEGDFVECGVAAGSKIIAMVKGLIDSNIESDRKVYAYDSFEGIPLPTNKDDQRPGICHLTPEEIENLPDSSEHDKFLKSSGVAVHSLENFWNNINRAGVDNKKIIAIEGWFEKTIYNHKTPIAYLRLDGDMYSATKVCLEHMFPLLSTGGILEIDDWGLPGCMKAVNEYFEGAGELTWNSVPNSSVVYLVRKK